MPKIPGVNHLLAVRALEKAGFRILGIIARFVPRITLRPHKPAPLLGLVTTYQLSQSARFEPDVIGIVPQVNKMPLIRNRGSQIMKQAVQWFLLGSILCWPLLAAADAKDGLTAYKQGDYDTAYREWRPLAEKGDAYAQNALGVLYKNGHGVSKDFAEAVRLFRKAADQGLSQAENNLGVMYLNGRGVDQSDNEALKWFRKSADQDNASAQYMLGRAYLDGWGVERSDTEALNWLHKASKQGHNRAQEILDTELTLLRRAIRLYSGRAGKIDEIEAKYLFEQAAQAENPLAVMWLARGYFAGRAGFRKDVQRGQKLAQGVMQEVSRLAEPGDPDALFLLGSVYFEGLGVVQNDKRALSEYLKAANQSHALAQANLGVMYRNGHGVRQSDAEAVKWFRKAANQGHPRAVRILADMGY